jgi:hypothetical protein
VLANHLTAVTGERGGADGGMCDPNDSRAASDVTRATS